MCCAAGTKATGSGNSSLLEGRRFHHKLEILDIKLPVLVLSLFSFVLLWFGLCLLASQSSCLNGNVYSVPVTIGSELLSM